MIMDTKKLLHFLGISFGITWCLGWGAMAILGVSQRSVMGNVMHFYSGYAPLIAALVCLEDKSLKSIFRFIFSAKKGSWTYLLLFSGLQFAVIALSSKEASGLVAPSLVPLLLIQSFFFFGGNEELGWRGTLQPLLEKRYPFWLASLITGLVWGFWHFPLWFIDGSVQRIFPFYQFAIYAIVLSFVLGAIYRKTQSVFYCSLFHGWCNILFAYFLIKVNLELILGLGLIVLLTLLLISKKETL